MINKLPVSVLIMTQNEEANIKFAIESVLLHFEQVIITDSFSTDKTVDIIKRYPGVELYQHKFINWADQRNWMLSNCRVQNDIIFFLDADEYIDERLVMELRDILEKKIVFSAIFLDREYIFLGRVLKYSHGHPWTFRIFKKQGLSFICEGAREYAMIKGPTIRMKSPYIHHDHKSLTAWLAKHNDNSDREAMYYLDRHSKKEILRESKLSKKVRIKLWIRQNLWNKFPLLVRPIFYFIYRYIIKLGFMDGQPGLIYCFMHSLLYQSMIDVKILEKQKQIVR